MDSPLLPRAPKGVGRVRLSLSLVEFLSEFFTFWRFVLASSVDVLCKSCCNPPRPCHVGETCLSHATLLPGHCIAQVFRGSLGPFIRYLGPLDPQMTRDPSERECVVALVESGT